MLIHAKVAPESTSAILYLSVLSSSIMLEIQTTQSSPALTMCFPSGYNFMAKMKPSCAENSWSIHRDESSLNCFLYVCTRSILFNGDPTDSHSIDSRTCVNTPNFFNQDLAPFLRGSSIDMNVIHISIVGKMVIKPAQLINAGLL